MKQAAIVTIPGSIRPPSGDVNAVVGNSDCRFPWTNV